MDRLSWISYLLVLLFCISATSNVYGDELSEGFQLMNDGTVKNSKKLDLVFLLHTSTQISDMSFKLIINFLKSVLRDVDVDSGDVRVGIAMYRRDSDILFNLDQYNSKKELIKAIESIPDDYRSDEANLARGLMVVSQIMLSEAKDHRPSVPNAVVIITDGISTEGSKDLKSAALMLKDIAYLFAVGVGIHTSAELNDVVSEPANINHFLVVSIDHLSDVEPQLTEQMMALQGDAAFPDGGDRASAKADVTFLVHVNKGAKKSAMEALVNFLKYLLTYADIDSGAVRVALAYYKLNVKVDFDFNAHSTRSDVYNALDQFKESKARSPKANVAGALKSLPRLLLNAKRGDRADAQNYVILITDLEANAKKNLIRANSQFLKKTGAKVLTVGVGFPNSAELRTIASDPPGLHSFFC